MKKTSVILALTLLSATPVAAKEVTAAKLCGAGGCAEVKDRNVLAALNEGGHPVDPPKSGASWYRADLTVEAGDARDSFSIAVVPGKRMIRTGGNGDGPHMWMPISVGAAEAIADATRSVEPFPAAKLAGAGSPSAPKPKPEEPAAADDGGSAWAWVAGGAAAALAALSGLVTIRRRRRAGRAGASPVVEPS